LIEVGDHPSLNSADKAILAYAASLTRSPARISKGEIDLLRSNNLDDRGIHDVCAITAYFAFVNRMADGLGIELEARFDES